MFLIKILINLFFLCLIYQNMVIRLYLKGKKKRFVVVFSMVVFLRLGYMYKFKFESVEYGEKWIAIYGQHMGFGF